MMLAAGKQSEVEARERLKEAEKAARSRKNGAEKQSTQMLNEFRRVMKGKGWRTSANIAANLGRSACAANHSLRRLVERGFIVRDTHQSPYIFILKEEWNQE